MKKIKWIETIYSQGTARYREDGFIINPPFIGVVDGQSAPYSNRIKPILFDGTSGGEMVRKIVLETFYSADKSESLEELVLTANKRVGKIQTSRGIPIDRSNVLPGACCAFTKINPDKESIDIVQAGDSFAVWVNNGGKIGITKNQTHLHEIREDKIIAELLKKHKGNKKKMWNEFYPHLCASRQRDVNKKTDAGYALLNGQPWFKEHWQKIEISTRDIDFLMLFTDGLVPVGVNLGNESEMIKVMVSFYREKGLSRILKETRISERGGKRGYTHHCEATGLVATFY